MYKDFKKTESLDTGFVGGSSLLWMFSGIVLGLLVGLGMYFFSNDRMSISMLESLEKKIQKVQTTNSGNKPLAQTRSQNKLQSQQQNFINSLNKQNKVEEKRKNKFSYYAVLPNLDVPIGSAKPINTSESATDIATNPTKSISDIAIAIASELPTTSIEKQEKPQLEELVEVATIGDYLLQVASFKKESMADKTRGRLNTQGIDAYVQKKKVKGRYWYRVVAGPVDQYSVDNWKHTAEKLGHKPLVISVR